MSVLKQLFSGLAGMCSYHASNSHGLAISLTTCSGSSYVPLLRRSWQLFHELQDEVGIPCIHRTGCLDVGSAIVQSAKAACEANAVEYTLMSGAEVSKLFPGYEFGKEEVCLPPATPSAIERVYISVASGSTQPGQTNCSTVHTLPVCYTFTESY